MHFMETSAHVKGRKNTKEFPLKKFNFLLSFFNRISNHLVIREQLVVNQPEEETFILVASSAGKVENIWIKKNIKT